VNTRDIKVTTVSFTIEAKPYKARFNGELSTPADSRDIKILQSVLEREARHIWHQSHNVNDFKVALEKLFSPSSKDSYRYFRRLNITVVAISHPTQGFKINNPHRSKSKSKRRKH